jgi:hypothetical protein
MNLRHTHSGHLHRADFFLYSSVVYIAPFRRIEAVPESHHTAVVTLSAVERRPGQLKSFFDDTKKCRLP